MMFTNRDLRRLIVPLFIEQLLLMLVGVSDTFIVSFASEADVSGVSLVNSFNTVLVFLFTALSSGGAVIISQYTGSGDERSSRRASGQLLMLSAVIASVLAAAMLIFPDELLRLLFGRVDDGVMAACRSYLRITAWSLPALAVYDAGAALCRSTGRAAATMYISAAANVINVIGNCIGVFALRAGAAGVAYPSLISRALSAAAITVYCLHIKSGAAYRTGDIFTWDGPMLKRIMRIALPNGAENGIHQLVKVALSSMVALFGTSQIAANGVAQSIWSLAAIMGLAMAPAYTTVIGQCMGAGDVKSANYYFKKLNWITLVLSVVWNALVLAATPLILSRSAISAETRSLVVTLVAINNAFSGIAYPFAGPLGSGLRAAGDVKFTMIVSIALTVAARFFFRLFSGCGSAGASRGWRSA